MAVDRIPAALLAWYDTNARTLPWRAPPGAPRADPYRVWLSEIMLQQTSVATVGPYFARFLARWPAVEALAAADEAEVMREWAGLGYYARARNLLAAARAVTARGGFPETEAGLRTLPGIGPYTAAAIAAIAFGESAVVIDGNIERVVSRLFAISTPLPAAKAAIGAALGPLVPSDRPGDFAQALMDLGATVCTPRKPDCAICPLARFCHARATGAPESYPVKPARLQRPVKQGLAWWIEADAAVALVRRPPRGLLGGMPGLPGTGWAATLDMRTPFAADWQPVPEPVVHGFTHFELRLALLRATLDRRPDTVDGEQLHWVPLVDLVRAGLPTLYVRAAEAAMGKSPLQEAA